MQPYIPPTPDYRLKMMNPDPTTTPVKTTKTYREYLNEVIVQEGVFVAVASQTLKEMRRKEGTNISEAGYNKILTDMTACLEKDMKAYAAWNDPPPAGW